MVVLEDAGQPETDKLVFLSSQFLWIMSFLSKVMQGFLNVFWIVTILYNLSEHPRSLSDSNDGNLVGLHFYYCIFSCWEDWLFDTFRSFHGAIATTWLSMGFEMDSKSTKWPNSMTANLVLLTAPFHRTIYVKMSWFASRTFMRKVREHRKNYSKMTKVTDYTFSAVFSRGLDTLSYLHLLF